MRRILLIALFTLSVLLLLNISFSDEPDFNRLRKRLVNKYIIGEGIKNQDVIRSMLTVPRELFVPDKYKKQAYEDKPLPIGYGQTISQPYIVALMTDLLSPEKDDKILEVGTGSGYQAAILAQIVKDVYTIEIIKPLAIRARERFKKLIFHFDPLRLLWDRRQFLNLSFRVFLYIIPFILGSFAIMISFLTDKSAEVYFNNIFKLIKDPGKF